MPHGRPEFVLETSQEPHAFVIRKQVRQSANPLERPVVLAYYYIVNNKIMQAPSAHQVTHARLQRCTFALQQGFARLQADLEPLTRQAKQLEKQEAKEQQAQAKQQQQQLQQQQPQPQQDQGTPGAAALGTGPVCSHGAAGQAAQPSQHPPQQHPPQRPPYSSVYGSTADLESPSLGTLRAPLAAPLPEVMAAAATTSYGGGSGVPVRRHLTDADRERWSKLDRILSHQFNSLSRIQYTALPLEYKQRLHAAMHGLPPPEAAAAAPPAAAPAGQPGQQAVVAGQ